jgi:hypothetical protein
MISTQLAAAVLGVSARRLDNLIVHAGRSAVPAGRSGSSRSMSLEIVERFALAMLLQRDLDLTLLKSMELAEQLQLDSGAVQLGVLGSLRFDMTRLRSVLQQALASAIEEHAVPSRGRPRKERK